MKSTFYIFLIAVLNFACSADNKDDAINKMQQELDIKTQTIELLTDSIKKLSTVDFDKFEPLAFAYSPILNKGEDLKLTVGHLAYNSTKDSKINYWIDDTTGNPNTMLTFSGQNGDGRIKIDHLKYPEGFTIGQHFIRGMIEKTENGKKQYGYWQYDYVVK